MYGPNIMWHYAVWKASWLYMMPACVSAPTDLESAKKHGITINRGDVNCSVCKHMMGMV